MSTHRRFHGTQIFAQLIIIAPAFPPPLSLIRANMDTTYTQQDRGPLTITIIKEPRALVEESTKYNSFPRSRGGINGLSSSFSATARDRSMDGGQNQCDILFAF